jgi:hypothetical protein
VSKKIMLSYGSVQHSDTYQTENPEPINMKFCTISMVSKEVKIPDTPKIVGIGWLGAVPQRGGL